MFIGSRHQRQALANVACLCHSTANLLCERTSTIHSTGDMNFTIVIILVRGQDRYTEVHVHVQYVLVINYLYMHVNLGTMCVHLCNN